MTHELPWPSGTRDTFLGTVHRVPSGPPDSLSARDRESWLRWPWLPLAVLLGSLIIFAALSVASWVLYDQAEQRLLAERTSQSSQVLISCRRQHPGADRDGGHDRRRERRQPRLLRRRHGRPGRADATVVHVGGLVPHRRHETVGEPRRPDRADGGGTDIGRRRSLRRRHPRASWWWTC